VNGAWHCLRIFRVALGFSRDGFRCKNWGVVGRGIFRFLRDWPAMCHCTRDIYCFDLQMMRVTSYMCHTCTKLLIARSWNQQLWCVGDRDFGLFINNLSVQLQQFQVTRRKRNSRRSVIQTKQFLCTTTHCMSRALQQQPRQLQLCHQMWTCLRVLAAYSQITVAMCCSVVLAARPSHGRFSLEHCFYARHASSVINWRENS